MRMRTILSLLILFCLNLSSTAQLKYIIDDFEGLAYGSSDIKPNGIFSYGNIKMKIEPTSSPYEYLGDRFIQLTKDKTVHYGGWGKGVTANVMLDASTDFLNVYVLHNSERDTTTMKIEMQDDDNGNAVFEKSKDDEWCHLELIRSNTAWQLISIPLSHFKDVNKGGDGAFNINYKEGKLLTFHIGFFTDMKSPLPPQIWGMDMICFSKGKLPTGASIYEAPKASPNDHCNLGAWSQEGNSGNFLDIATAFESHFKQDGDKKLGVLHFFQPFSFDGGRTENSGPSIERINTVVHAGYIPMITLEDHFANTSANKTKKQPNLYSIVEGHFDSFLVTWAKQIKQVDGIVLLRILHEFNGDWYPWCTSNNDKDPKLLVKAYRHIHDIFRKEQAWNVKFIWCPNSMSIPQESWNFVLEAYPGNEYVDFVALDLYNGAGKAALWRSFRKEGIENYFILTQAFPDKPLIVCEVASRERESGEPVSGQSKAEWINDMSQALCSDMSKIKLITWFNEKGKFRINTTPESVNAFRNSIWKNPHFKTGTVSLYSMFKK